MSYPPQPPMGPPPPPPKAGMSTGSKVGLGCGGCLGLLLVLGLMGGCMSVLSGDTPDTSTPSSAGSSSDSEPEEAAADGDGDGEAAEEDHPGLGEVIEHGDWEITVEGIEYDVPTSDLDSVLAEEPSGQWVTVSISATNISSGPAYFDGTSQVLMDADGSMYSSDVMASDGLGLLEEANPGSTVSGALAYDVPADLEIDHMLVNGKTMLDDGVRVDLE